MASNVSSARVQLAGILELFANQCKLGLFKRDNPFHSFYRYSIHSQSIACCFHQTFNCWSSEWLSSTKLWRFFLLIWNYFGDAHPLGSFDRQTICALFEHGALLADESDDFSHQRYQLAGCDLRVGGGRMHRERKVCWTIAVFVHCPADFNAFCLVMSSFDPWWTCQRSVDCRFALPAKRFLFCTCQPNSRLPTTKTGKCKRAHQQLRRTVFNLCLSVSRSRIKAVCTITIRPNWHLARLWSDPTIPLAHRIKLIGSFAIEHLLLLDCWDRGLCCRMPLMQRRLRVWQASTRIVPR